MNLRAPFVRHALGAVAAAALVGHAASAAAQYAPTAPPRTPVAPAPAPSALPPGPAAAPPAPPATAPAAAPAPVDAVAPEPSSVEPPAPEVAPAPEAAAEPPATPAKKDEKPAVAVHYDKGFVLSSADGAHLTRAALRMQFRFESTRPTEDGAEFQSRSYITRTRLQFEGHVHGADNRYKLELGLSDRGSFSFVREVFLDRKLEGVWVRAGQWRRPHNRQELVSDFASNFNERAITADFVGGGRDVGVGIHNDYEKSPEGLEWVFGVFNNFAGGADRPTIATTCSANMAGAITCSNAAATNVPADFSPTLVGHVGWNQGKIKGYSEGDLEGGPLRYAVGASYKLSLANFDQGMQSSVAKNFSHSIALDAMVKVAGFDALAGFYVQKLPGQDAQFGGLIQTGYFLTPKKVQIAGRFAMHQAPLDRSLIEGRAALSYFFIGHSYKLAMDAGMTQLTGEDANGVADKPDLNARVMVQMQF